MCLYVLEGRRGRSPYMCLYVLEDRRGRSPYICVYMCWRVDVEKVIHSNLTVKTLSLTDNVEPKQLPILQY